jgi:hypothetical protein
VYYSFFLVKDYSLSMWENSKHQLIFYNLEFAHHSHKQVLQAFQFLERVGLSTVKFWSKSWHPRKSEWTSTMGSTWHFLQISWSWSSISQGVIGFGHLCQNHFRSHFKCKFLGLTLASWVLDLKMCVLSKMLKSFFFIQKFENPSSPPGHREQIARPQDPTPSRYS